MSPPPVTGTGSLVTSSRGIAGTSTASDCRVEIEKTTEGVILDFDEVLQFSQSMAEILSSTANNWRTELDLAKDVPEQIQLLKKILKEFGLKGSSYVKKIGNKRYVILKGYAGLRETLKGTKYLVDNAKVVTYGIGRQGSMIMKGNIVSIVILSALNVLETIISDDKDFIDATAQFTTDVAKTIATGVAVAAVSAAASAFAAPVVVTVGAVVVVGIVVALLLDQVDAHFQITASLSDWLRKEYEEAAKRLGEQGRQIEREWSWCNSPGGVMSCMERMFGGY